MDLVDYERAPSVSMDTKKEYMLLMYRNTYKTLDDLNQDELRLGGLRINPVTNISSTTTYSNNIKLRKIKDKAETQVSGLPENAKISNISWSPDEKKIAFSNTSDTGVALWVVDVASAKAMKLTEDNVNANLGNPFSWYSDNESILVRMLPKNRPALLDEKKNLPTGPIVSNANGTSAVLPGEPWNCDNCQVMVQGKRCGMCHRWKDGQRDHMSHSGGGNGGNRKRDKLDLGTWTCNCGNEVQEPKSRCGKCHHWKGGRRTGGWKLGSKTTDGGTAGIAEEDIDRTTDWECCGEIISAAKTRCGKCKKWRGGGRLKFVGITMVRMIEGER